MSEIVHDEVTAVAMYPIKSCAPATVDGERPEVLDVAETGFEAYGVRDRDYVLYDTDEATFISQRGWKGGTQRTTHREDRRLSMVGVDIRHGYMEVTSSAGLLHVDTSEYEGDWIDIDVFGKRLPAVEQSVESSAYFSRLLGRNVMLLRADRERPRLLPEKYRYEGGSTLVSGTDSMPFLLVNEASLRASVSENGLPAGAVTIDRYRPSIVIGGEVLGSYGEDHITKDNDFMIGELAVRGIKACARCPIPNIDQRTSEFNGQSSKALRGRAGIIYTGERGVFFGLNLVHRYQPGQSVGVGDRVAVGNLSVEPNVILRNIL